MIFHSDTFGDVALQGIHEYIKKYIQHAPHDQYEVVIGTDSQKKQQGTTDFVTAIIVRRIGKGGIYFWSRDVDSQRRVLKQRMFEEATRSLVIAQQVLDQFAKYDMAVLDMVIHVDIGNHGPTREMISEVVAMIRGSGFDVKTKPDSYGASKVADRHT